MTYDYRAQAYKIAGSGNEELVTAVAAELHYNESLHMHNLGEEKQQHSACGYCWLRAGRAVHALVMHRLIPATPVPTGEQSGKTTSDGDS